MRAEHLRRSILDTMHAMAKASGRYIVNIRSIIYPEGRKATTQSYYTKHGVPSAMRCHGFPSTSYLITKI